MHHVLDAARPHLHGRFSSRATPVLTLEPGDTVSVTNIPDVSWGLEAPTSTTAPRRKVEPRDPVRDAGPCLCGPIAVRGAKPGDALDVTLEHIRPGPWGWTYAGRGMSHPSLNAAIGIADAPLTLLRWTINQARTHATNDLGHTVRLRPFMGTIGLSPDADDACAWTPRACGGNMDCRELVEGTVLSLPVMTPGALLSLGDGHALQGDGELSGTAIECPIEEVRLRVDLRPGVILQGPRARTHAGWITLGFSESLDQAATAAASGMLDLLVEQRRLSRAQAAALASSVVSLHITQMVNPLRGVHAVLAE